MEKSETKFKGLLGSAKIYLLVMPVPSGSGFCFPFQLPALHQHSSQHRPWHASGKKQLLLNQGKHKLMLNLQ